MPMDENLVKDFINENYMVAFKTLTENNYMDYYNQTVMIVIADFYELKKVEQLI